MSELGDLLSERARIEAELQAATRRHDENANRLFGRNLKRLREVKGLTQGQLADLVGLSRTSITNQEAGRQASPWATVVLLADALGASLEEFRRDD